MVHGKGDTGTGNHARASDAEGGFHLVLNHQKTAKCRLELLRVIHREESRKNPAVPETVSKYILN